MAKILYYSRASKENGIVIDSRRFKLDICECGALVIDIHAHARHAHSGITKLELRNPENGEGEIIKSRSKIKKLGKTLHVVGANKK